MQNKPFQAPEIFKPANESIERQWTSAEIATKVMSKASKKSHELYVDYLIEFDLPWIFELKDHTPTPEPINLKKIISFKLPNQVIKPN